MIIKYAEKPLVEAEDATNTNFTTLNTRDTTIKQISK